MMDDFSRPAVVLESTLRSTDYNDTDEYSMDSASARLKFREFFRSFHIEMNYIYRDELIRQKDKGEYFVEVDFAHLSEYNLALYNNILTNPTHYHPLFEASVKDALILLLTKTSADNLYNQDIPDFQIIYRSSQIPISLRSLTADHVNKIVKIPGIVIKASEISNKATTLGFVCSKCNQSKTISVRDPFSSVVVPNKCDAGDCGPQTYEIDVDLCKYVDQQKLKIQESPEVVPTGEMPRNIMAVMERYLIDRVSPGTRLDVIGVLSLTSGKSGRGSSGNVRAPFIRVLGLSIANNIRGQSTVHFAPHEEELMQQLARDSRIYERIAKSIAPQISGDYTQDIKKALACLLFGGSRTILDDGTRLRGDINVLLMGDPSTAKSQFLKFIEKVAPIGVYTSGKGTSAAGLTAAVVKDAKGEFYLEGGAMVLADGGVICIDEFDKMRETDRVAIHEAMEQQTISIAKAGITTILNTRSSVLAAANPIYGRYDDLKDVGENIDLMTTILSRFDCIFIVRDVRDHERDRGIARHVLGLHMQAAMNESAGSHVSYDSDTLEPALLKKFITYCRERCAPKLNNEAAALLSGQYVHIRSSVREALKDKQNETQVVPITVRQLEALIRISESLAKMRLNAEATVADVNEAIRLFRISTLAASKSNPALLGNINQNSQDIRRAEEFLKSKIGVKGSINLKSITEEAVLQGHMHDSIMKAIAAMILRNELQEYNNKKMLRRLR